MKTNAILTLVFSFVAAVLFSANAYAQEPVAPEGYVYVDSLIYVQNVSIDSTLVDKDIFLDMPSEALGAEATVTVGQSELIEQSMRKHVEANQSRALSGYRVRIFFDNKQTARVESDELEKEFQLQFPQIPTYRSYTNPFFKVVVGDYRTKSDAIRELGKILPFYPKAIVVREAIFFPEI